MGWPRIRLKPRSQADAIADQAASPTDLILFHDQATGQPGVINPDGDPVPLSGAHGHPQSDVVDLGTDLAGKADAAHIHGGLLPARFFGYSDTLSFPQDGGGHPLVFPADQSGLVGSFDLDGWADGSPYLTVPAAGYVRLQGLAFINCANPTGLSIIPSPNPGYTIPYFSAQTGGVGEFAVWAFMHLAAGAHIALNVGSGGPGPSASAELLMLEVDFLPD